MVTTQRNEDLQRIIDSGVIAVIRGADADTVIDIADALHAGGVTALEVTADTPGAIDMIDEVSASFGDGEALIGAGTVLDSETARSAMLAGAEFIVSPNLNTDVIEICNRYNNVVAPGVMTPTEAVEATEAGADVVKVFPASSLGPGHLSSMKGPLGHIEMVPTGGVSLDNVEDFIDAGASAVGVGSALVDYDAVEAGNFGELTETAREFTQKIETARQR